MREIRFRGHTGEIWVYGSLIQWPERTQIKNVDLGAVDVWDVNPETVGQYIGLKDKHGDEIYEDDIIAGFFVWGAVGGIVEYDSDIAAFCTKRPDNITFDTIDPRNYTVVGNIHNNPKISFTELLAEDRGD